MNHITKDGIIIKITAMDNRHLINTIRCLQRVAENGVLVRLGGRTDADDMWYEEEMIYGKDALYVLNYDSYVNEAERRGLNVSDQRKR